MDNYLLKLKAIGKVYSGTRVLNNINISVKEGEIHALLGENGAGKSTLMNILFGMDVIHTTGGYEGEIIFNGKTQRIMTPADAMTLGIGMVHQEFMLLPGFTVTENIKLNREDLSNKFLNKLLPNRLKSLNKKKMKKDARLSLDTVGLGIDEWLPVQGMPVGYKQFIEIARELDKTGIKLLVFDEPTAVLTEEEARGLLKTMKQIAQKGISILFITHRLDEVIEVANQITILRDGELVASLNKQETNVAELAKLMVGREVTRVVERREVNEDIQSVLSIKNLRVKMPGEMVRGIDIEIKQGEILGIGGLGGQGKMGIANGIMGLYPAKGKVFFRGNPLNLNDPYKALKSGLAMVSEDRRGVGLLLNTSIAENIIMTAMHINGDFLRDYKLFKLKNSKEINKHATQCVSSLDIRCTGINQIVKRLSGGNQQKVCIARALTLNPSVLFVSEPTRGIDVGAKHLVLKTLIKLNREQGITIIMTSSELAELRSICDRIMIMHKGKKAGILPPDASDVDFGLMMAGEYNYLNNKGAS
ncbi:sugar ABC transporter ATP-binding protein [Clostridium sp. 'deep sea']|uniref:sugar ABC transporter ATP-binding protein n=1 Tax=Clostridium sp. 'deep sea' TaxID=2779445 RepID=UPI0018965071|nr:sugar ABC transporter ATP-binding protein [Clostridium sp. 'deep sea']QOR34384.1 sugar ABC transporter ATP-binding protein [Clostridium sp. 'deep sea']